MTYKKVSPKDPFKFPARLYNELIDNVVATRKKQGFNNKATKHKTPYYIQNKTGKKLPIYSVVMITGISNFLSDSADSERNLDEFIDVPLIFKGEIPNVNSKHFSKICITQEPLEIDAVGSGIIDGLSQCIFKLKETVMYDPSLKSYLSVEDQNTDNLLISNYGTLEVVDFTVDTDVIKKETNFLGVVNLSSVLVPAYFLVDLVWKSGGDSTTAYEARIYDIVLNNSVIKSEVDISSGNNPYRRPQDYNVTKANIAMAFAGSDGDVLISWANEYPLLGTAEIMP